MELQQMPGTGEMENAEAPNTSGVIHDTPDLRASIRTAMDRHDEIDDERGKLNADKQSVRKSIKAQGINLKAFDVALRRRRLKEQKDQDEFDASLEICLGVASPQPDLFRESDSSVH